MMLNHGAKDIMADTAAVTEADMQIKTWLLMQRVKEKTQRINSRVSLPKEEEEMEEGERRRGGGGIGEVRGGRREKKGRKRERRKQGKTAARERTVPSDPQHREMKHLNARSIWSK